MKVITTTDPDGTTQVAVEEPRPTWRLSQHSTQPAAKPEGGKP